MKKIFILKSTIIFICSALFYFNLSYAGQIVPAKFYEFDSDGTPLNGGKLYTYIAGTSTKKNTYSDSALTIPNENPVVLDSDGRASIFGTGTYKIILAPSDDTDPPTNPIWTMDNIEVINFTAIHDTDSDTQIQVEESSDEDIIRFDIGGTEQLTIQDGKIEPTTDNDIDLGSGSKRFRHPYIEAFIGYFQRATFSRKDSDEIYIDPPGTYEVNGKWAYITSQITMTGSIGVVQFEYLYIDYSEIPADGVIDSTDLYVSGTTPSWSDSKKGWYHTSNTDDRCIFAVLEEVSTIPEFRHDGGDFLAYSVDTLGGQTAKHDRDFDAIDVEDSWDDVYLEIPSFSTKAQVTMQCDYGGDVANSIGYWQPGSTTEDDGHAVCVVFRNSTNNERLRQFNTFIVATDSSGVISVEYDVANVYNVMSIYINGWFFPRGM